MSAPAAHISVLAGDHFACVKIQGRANFASSIDFNTVVSRLRELGFSYFVIELSECALMDSTFLGVLAGFGLKMTQANGQPAGHCVELRNPNARLEELLENIGVLHLFKIGRGDLASPEKLDTFAHEPACASREDMTRTCLRAHELLMELNPANVPRFKDVTKFLAEDLAKLQAAAGKPVT